MERHLITSEYPPQGGGVGDYSELIAKGLAAEGETVHVWCPSYGTTQHNVKGVTVHQELGRIGPADMRRVGRMLDQFPRPRRLLVQWVPHGYGYQSMNLSFCLWLWQRAKIKHDWIEIMVHEPFLAFGGGSWKQGLVAAVHRTMIVTLLMSARRVWVSIPLWETLLRPFAFGRSNLFSWLPVPSNIPVIGNDLGNTELRSRYASREEIILGHFGAYDSYMTEVMLELVPSLLNQNDQLSVLLLGKGGVGLRNLLINRRPSLNQRVYATSALSSEDISRHLSVCDLMMQPYQDGVSGRRGSVMAALAHGVPVVTTTGKASEQCWAESRAVKLVEKTTAMAEAVQSLSADSAERRRLGVAGKALYEKLFDVERTIVTLRAEVSVLS